ncbi:glutamate synthase [NADPH] small chain [bacterium BMS3Abin01]|nr:glutamate synthase [NADPH] small chain [bacterium BMS3Abin01]
MTDRNDVVRLTIEGREVEAAPGMTIFEAARDADIRIPNLCNDGRIEPVASCRMCVIAIGGEAGLKTACTTPVADGMKVSVDNEQLRSVRRLVLELILSDHNAYCLPPCQNGCPDQLDIPGYVKAVADGDPREAVRIIKQRLPFPRVLGRVCPRPCESVCRRGENDDPVSICNIKRFAGDEAAGQDVLPFPREEASGMKVAVVGAGPAGLTCAYYLALKGHQVIIHESLPEPGGMLRYAIPEYRLPTGVLEEELEELWSLGVELKTESAMGRDFDIDSLLADGYRAVFLAMGAHGDHQMMIPGEEAEGVLSSVDFLRRVRAGDKVEIGRRVVVVGGGFTAIDAARTAIRLGAEESTIVYRRSREQMPAHESEVEEAEIEGVSLQLLAIPELIETLDGRAKALRCLQAELVKTAGGRRPRPMAIPGSEFDIIADTIIVAIGQKPKLYHEEDGRQVLFLPEKDGVKTTEWGTIEANRLTLQTERPQVFAGGDVVSGPATVIQAVAAGRKAAANIDAYLRGESVVESSRQFTEAEPVYLDIKQVPQVDTPRQPMPTLCPERCCPDFTEVELGFTWQQARMEATRCMQCVCQAEQFCELRRLGAEYGITSNRFQGAMRRVPVVEDGNPVISRDYEKCIDCGACAGICDEQMAVQAVEMAGTGMDTHVACAFEGALKETDCVFCGQCVSVCPTGALDNRMSRDLRPLPLRGKPEEVQEINTTCCYCGVGCSLTLNVDGGRIIEVTADDDCSVNGASLCVKGRYGFDFIQNPERLRQPLVRRDGELVPVSWEEALEEVRANLERIRDQHGGRAIGALASGRCTNEDNYLMQKFIRSVIGSNNVDHCARL